MIKWIINYIDRFKTNNGLPSLMSVGKFFSIYSEMLNFILDLVFFSRLRGFFRNFQGVSTNKFVEHSCLVKPPKVPSHPFEVSVHPLFWVQHEPSVPHHGQGPCLLLQEFQQSNPVFLISFLPWSTRNGC